MIDPSPAKSLLEELTSQFPDHVRAPLLDALRRARIHNPDDPIFELMIVLGTWGNYYETIPQRVKEAGDVIGDSIQSFDKRLRLLNTLTKSLQVVADKMATVPKELVELFPIKKLADNIAEKIDFHFKFLQLTKVEAELRSLRLALIPIMGTSSQKGLAEQFKQTLDSLQSSAKHLANAGIASQHEPVKVAYAAPAPWRAALLSTLSAMVLTTAILWVFVIAPMRNREPAMSEISQVLRQERFLSQHVSAGINEHGVPMMFIPVTQIMSTQKDNAGNLTINFNFENR